MGEKHRKQLMQLGVAAVSVVLLCVTVLTSALYAADTFVSDILYAKLEGTNRNIKIITVDEETLNAYGNFQQWSREKAAELAELLYADEGTAPALIGYDFMFTGEKDEKTDSRLAQACEGGKSVFFASNLVYRGVTKQDSDGNIYYDTWNVSMVEEPYAALQEVSSSGFTNAYIASDGCVRYTKLFEQYEEETVYSFAYQIYEAYEEKQGREAVLPQMDKNGMMTFLYSGKVGEYSHFSLVDVLEGNVPAEEFKDCIVLVGAYAPGFQDSYVAAVERGTPMYGVEIQANIIQALMDGKTAVAAPTWMYLLIVCIVILLFVLMAEKQKLIPVIAEAIVLGVIHMIFGRLLAAKGYIIPQIYFLLILFLLILYYIIEKYFGEKLRRKKMLSTFKKYVASQVVDKLSKDESFEIRLGGEKRHVAVLFVDIRGFTPLSESLKPEEVVKILNEYLALTTSCILEQNGMLDKFVGDATMAVFNAPFDLDDYIYRAVLTAWNMRVGAEPLAEKLMEKCGRTVGFGIGVNCGEAVVGNIGCEFRMDYTAIGDTVNTAARLESKAKAGEILISDAVYQSLRGRIEVEEVGEMELKGKSKAVMVYRVTGITDEKVC